MKRIIQSVLILSLFVQFSYAQTQTAVQTVEEYKILFNTLVERINAAKTNAGLYMGRSFYYFVNYLNENNLQITRTAPLRNQPDCACCPHGIIGLVLWFTTTENFMFMRENGLAQPVAVVRFHERVQHDVKADSLNRVHQNVFTKEIKKFYADAVVNRVTFQIPNSIDAITLENINSYGVFARRITRVVTDEMGIRIPLTVSEAQEWFENAPSPTRGWGDISIPSGNDSFWNRDFESITVVPDWSLAVERTDTSRDIVELPWRYEDDIKKPIALLPVWEYFKEKGMTPPSVDKMLIIRDVGSNRIWISRMQILPDLDYVLNHGDRLHTNTYFHRCRYLSGVVIFSNSRGFSTGWRMRQGRITGELRHNHLGTIRTERLPLLKNNLGADEDNDVVLTLFRDGFMFVRSYKQVESRYAQ